MPPQTKYPVLLTSPDPFLHVFLVFIIISKRKSDTILMSEGHQQHCGDLSTSSGGDSCPFF